MTDDDDIVKEFLIESYENLDRLDRELVTLETNPTDHDTLSSIFRTIHTIKGTAGFLAFHQLESVTHAGESLLARLRDGQLELNSEITTALLAMVDVVRQILSSIESTSKEGQRDDSSIIATLTRLQQVQKTEASRAPVNTNAATKEEPATSERPSSVVSPPQERAVAATANEVTANPVTANPPESEHVVVEDSSRSDSAGSGPNQHPGGHAASDSTIRVDVSLLDQLMNTVGELVLTRNQILQVTNVSEASGLLATSQRLNLITTELQEGVMKTRMQPIGNIWSKFPRVVRDLAVACCKQVRIEMEGKATELDKTIIEAIKDPLTHLVRNAVDHGIELPESRQKAGKNPEGRLTLRAFHEGGQVNIEISDDGAGLDLDRIRRKAIQKGLGNAEQISRLSDRDAANLIFLPGLSTAEKVTNVSGRGVGMDVVKTNIEKIGGTVDMQSKSGQGTTVRMKIPLTLAIIPALIITSAGDRYAIPQVSLVELVRLEGEDGRHHIELIHDTPVYRLRGRLLPLVYLNRELKADKEVDVPTQINVPMVREKHHESIETLRQLLTGGAATAEMADFLNEKCKFEQWLESNQSTRGGVISDVQKLEEAHRSFHSLIRETIALRGRGETTRATQELANADQAFTRMMELLAAVERRLLVPDSVNIVVLQADDQQFGLVVDDINDTEEIVVKPLNKQLKNINAYSGATIMGDGQVALILDVMGLAQRANVTGETRDHTLTEKDERHSSAGNSILRKAVLLFQFGDKGRMGIDLSSVARLEEFSFGDIERVGDQRVVQYRGQIMPLLYVSELLSAEQSAESQAERKSVQVVVYADKGRSVGLVVDKILDVVETAFVLDRNASRKGIAGSAVLQERATEILDVGELIALGMRAEPLQMAAHA